MVPYGVGLRSQCTNKRLSDYRVGIYASQSAIDREQRRNFQSYFRQIRGIVIAVTRVDPYRLVRFGRKFSGN